MKRLWLTLAATLVACAVHAQDGTPRTQARQDAQHASGGATAVRPPPGNAAASDAMFNRMDRNRDGYLSGAELTGPVAQQGNWLSVDRDGDGRISRPEFTAIGNGEIAVTQRP